MFDRVGSCSEVPHRQKKKAEPKADLGPATPFPETPGPVKSPSPSDGDDNGNGNEEKPPSRQDRLSTCFAQSAVPGTIPAGTADTPFLCLNQLWSLTAWVALIGVL